MSKATKTNLNRLFAECTKTANAAKNLPLNSKPCFEMYMIHYAAKAAYRRALAAA